jgi:hypothetical protein
MKKNPNDTQNILQNLNNCIKYLPLDKTTTSILSCGSGILSQSNITSSINDISQPLSTLSTLSTNSTNFSFVQFFFLVVRYKNQDDPSLPFRCGRQKFDNKINYGLSSADKNSIINNYGQIQKILHYNTQDHRSKVQP